MNTIYKIIPIMMIVVSITLSVIVAVKPHTFGARCAQAGFENAEHEACVLRLMNGGTVYEENSKYRR